MKPHTLLIIIVIILTVTTLGISQLSDLHFYTTKPLDVGFSTPCVFDDQGRIQFTLVLYVRPYPDETLTPKKVSFMGFEATSIIPLSNKTWGEALSPETFTDFKVLFKTNRNLTFYYNTQRDTRIGVTYTSESSSQIREAGTHLRISVYCNKNESVI